MQMLVLYETIFGHNLELAQQVQEKFPTSNLVKISAAKPESLKAADLVVLCPCTYGEGQLTAPEVSFCQGLDHTNLADTSYLVTGVGDKDYGSYQFARAAIIFDHYLKAAGAQPIAKPLRIDYDELNDKAKQIVTIIQNWQREADNG